MFADHGAALACLAVTGRDAGALAWLPLFIIQGVGIRFGVRWLFASQAIGVASVGLTCAFNPFFRDNLTVALGALLSVLVLPLYFALLARREAQVKAALEEARRSAEEANEAKGRFVAMISHELRTPLTGISGLNELLRQQSLPANAQQMLAEQHAATSLMLTMVNDVLDLTKVEAGQMQLQEMDFDPQELALTVLHGLSFQAKQKGLAIRTELDASLPASLRGSPFHVSRILQNLLGNAIKFTSEGVITLRVKRGGPTCTEGVTTIEFEVIDTGIGIPEAALPKIFDRFYQVDAAVTRRFGGTGLGTSLVKDFCDLLQGSVRLESQLGKGTHCFVSLPFKRAEEVAQSIATFATGATVVAWCEDIVDWPIIKAELMAVGASVVEIGERRPLLRRVDGNGDPLSSVLLWGSVPSERALAVTQAMGLKEAVSIVTDKNLSGMRWRPGSGRAVIATTPKAQVVRALQLAIFGDRSLSVPIQAATEEVRPNTSARRVSSVLIAEDTPTIQLVMRATLENAGFAVTTADDGEQALKEAMNQHYDVVVLDWNMPKMDGIDVLRRIKSNPGPNAKTPVLIATAAPAQSLVDQALTAGARAVVGKPFARDELVRCVSSAIGCILDSAPMPLATASSRSGARREVAPILDIEALESPSSIFNTINPTRLMSAFKRDVAKHRVLLKEAVANMDLVLFRASVHSLTGYAGTLGAKRLEYLLSTVPQDAEELRAYGSTVANEICETMELTVRAFEKWSKKFLFADSMT